MKFICLLRQNGKKKEKGGGGGVAYAFYIMMILFVVLFCHFLIHRATLQAFYHEFSDLVYSLEGKLLTYTRSKDFQYTDTNGIKKNGVQFWDENPYAMTYKSSVIVANASEYREGENPFSENSIEKQQLVALATKLRNDLIREAQLDSSMKPQKSSLLSMIDTRGEKGKIQILTFRIYQPVYEHTIQTSGIALSSQDKAKLAEYLKNNKLVEASNFIKEKMIDVRRIVNRKIIGWNLYEVVFNRDTNLPTTYQRTGVVNDLLTNSPTGYPNISGSTVELELGTDIVMLGSIWNSNSNEEGFFTEYQQDSCFVSILQRQDIVFAAEDNRKQR